MLPFCSEQLEKLQLIIIKIMIIKKVPAAGTRISKSACKRASSFICFVCCLQFILAGLNHDGQLDLRDSARLPPRVLVSSLASSSFRLRGSTLSYNTIHDVEMAEPTCQYGRPDRKLPPSSQTSKNRSNQIRMGERWANNAV